MRAMRFVQTWGCTAKRSVPDAQSSMCLEDVQSRDATAIPTVVRRPGVVFHQHYRNVTTANDLGLNVERMRVGRANGRLTGVRPRNPNVKPGVSDAFRPTKSPVKVSRPVNGTLLRPWNAAFWPAMCQNVLILETTAS